MHSSVPTSAFSWPLFNPSSDGPFPLLFEEEELEGEDSFEEADHCWEAVILENHPLIPGISPSLNPALLSGIIHASGSQIAPATDISSQSAPDEGKNSDKPEEEKDTQFLNSKPATEEGGGIRIISGPLSIKEEFNALCNILFNNDQQDLPYSHSRFTSENLPGDFYINASCLPEGIILAETPALSTKTLFWHMAYACGTKIIVSTAEEEQNPHLLDVRQILTFGSLQIMRFVEGGHTYIIPAGRIVNVRNYLTQNKDNKKHSNKILHYYFSKELLKANEMHWLVVHLSLNAGSKPIIFQSDSCKTGNVTLLSICYYLYQIHRMKKEASQIAEINLPKFIIFLRSYFRFGIVQSLEEYTLLYDFVRILENPELLG